MPYKASLAVVWLKFDFIHRPKKLVVADGAMQENDFTGCLLGAATGDALGAPLEFSERRSEFENVVDMKFIAHFELPAGTWTDDTTLTLAVALSLIYRSGIHDGLDFFLRALFWQSYGYLSLTGDCFDIGRNCLASIEKFGSRLRSAVNMRPYSLRDAMVNQEMLDEHLKPLTQTEVTSLLPMIQGRLYPRCYGIDSVDEVAKYGIDVNCGGDYTTAGALMRISPVALVYANEPERALEIAAEHSRLTHASDESIGSCVLYVSLILGALRGMSKNDLLTTPSTAFVRFAERNRMSSRVLRLSDLSTYRNKDRDEIKTGEDVVDMLEAALWSFTNTETFEEGVILAVNLRHDADTVGCIFGGLAGAYYGADEIPGRYLGTLQKHLAIENIAKRLFRLSTNVGH